MRVELAKHYLLVALTAATSACAQGQTTGSEGVRESTAGTLLASVEIAPSHLVRFYEVEPGVMVATESGKLENHAPLLGYQDIDSYVTVFQSLARGQEVPAALVAAEARRTALRAQATSMPLAARFTSNGDGPDFYTTGEQTWFRQTFCPYGVPKCVQGWDWIDSGWDYTTDWRSTAMVGSEGSVAAPHIAYWWKCSGGSCWWETLLSATVSPGYYHWISGGGGWFYFKGTLTGAGGNTQVSMAITDGPYQCAHCNDGSCHCAYNVPDNLCRNNGGNDPNIGCAQIP